MDVQKGFVLAADKLGKAKIVKFIQI